MEKPRLKYNLQFFGGRGSSGESLPGSSNKPINILNTEDVWSIRNHEGNAPYVDQINTSVATIKSDFPGVMDTVQSVDAATMGGADAEGTLGFWSASDGTLALNKNYTDVQKMNNVYDKAVESGYHPSRGIKTGVEAVTYHEMGHALTDSIASKMGVDNLDKASERVVNDAYKATKGRGGTKAWAGKISGYAKESYAECVAEAVADYYCNGRNASANSRAIMSELRKYK